MELGVVGGGMVPRVVHILAQKVETIGWKRLNAAPMSLSRKEKERPSPCSGFGVGKEDGDKGNDIEVREEDNGGSSPKERSDPVVPCSGMAVSRSAKPEDGQRG